MGWVKDKGSIPKFDKGGKVTKRFRSDENPSFYLQDKDSFDVNIPSKHMGEGVNPSKYYERINKRLSLIHI